MVKKTIKGSVISVCINGEWIDCDLECSMTEKHRLPRKRKKLEKKQWNRDQKTWSVSFKGNSLCNLL